MFDFLTSTHCPHIIQEIAILGQLATYGVSSGVQTVVDTVTSSPAPTKRVKKIPQQQKPKTKEPAESSKELPAVIETVEEKVEVVDKDSPEVQEASSTTKAEPETKPEQESSTKVEPEPEQEPKVTIDPDSIIHPVTFDKIVIKEQKVDPKGVGIDDKLYERLVKEVAIPYLENRCKYRFERYDNQIQLFTVDNAGVARSYQLDPGICIGCGKIYILANTPNNKIYIPMDKTNLVEKVIKDMFYILTPDEIQEVQMDQFRNQNIYKYVSMQDTDMLSKISKEDFQLLGKKLTSILTVLKGEYDEDTIPRMRFEKFKSVDDFVLVSDMMTISPRISEGDTTPFLDNGLFISVDGNKIDVRKDGVITQYLMENYGEM